MFVVVEVFECASLTYICLWINLECNPPKINLGSDKLKHYKVRIYNDEGEDSSVCVWEKTRLCVCG